MPIIKLCAFYSCKQNEDNIEEMDRLVDSATCFIFPRANSLSELKFYNFADIQSSFYSH